MCTQIIDLYMRFCSISIIPVCIGLCFHHSTSHKLYLITYSERQKMRMLCPVRFKSSNTVKRMRTFPVVWPVVLCARELNVTSVNYKEESYPGFASRGRCERAFCQGAWYFRRKRSYPQAGVMHAPRPDLLSRIPGQSSVQGPKRR
eukprot:SAG11_NODE_9542_length_902_cov_1.029888_1_plen_146_part_00